MFLSCGLLLTRLNQSREPKVVKPPAAKPYVPVQSYASELKPKLVEGFGKGLMEDIKGKAPFLVSDIKDGFSIKVLSTVFFLFFACLAPAVAFGGMLGIATSGAMGTIEVSSRCFHENEMKYESFRPNDGKWSFFGGLVLITAIGCVFD